MRLTFVVCTAISTMLSAASASALESRVVDGPTFQAMSEGRTMYFNQRGMSYGAEQFFTDRRSIWQYADGSCTYGQWFAEGESICFVYERDLFPQCWIFTERSGTFHARLADVPEADQSELTLVRTDDKPLDCPGPDTGM